MKKILEKIRPIDLFLIISLINTAVFLFVNLVYWGRPLSASTLGSGKQFCDYFYHTAFSSARSSIYMESVDACFPPLAYCMYYFLWRTAPYLDEESVLNWRNYMTADNALLVFLLYNMVLVVLLGFCIMQYYRKTEAKYVLIFPLAVLVSYPTLCTSIQRGNAVLLVTLMLSFAWLWMDSDYLIKKEAAMLLIAVSAGFKIYPAILGIEYIRRKDWKRVIRLVIYGIILFFVPFLFFGGKEGIMNFISILGSHASWTANGHYGTVRGITEILWNRSGMNNEHLLNPIGFLIENLFFVSSILFYFMSKTKWQRVLFLSGILASYLGYNWAYTIVYYLPALFVFLQENKGKISQYNKKECIWILINTVGFAVIFSIPWFFQYLFEDGIYEGIFIVSYVMLFVNAVYVIRHRLKNKGKRYECQKKIKTDIG